MNEAGPDEIVFDSAGVPPSRRLRAWQDFVGDHLADVDLSYPEAVAREQAFSGSLTVRPRGTVTFARVCGAHQRLVRTPSRIRRASHESVLLTLVEKGSCRIAQNGRTATLGPGDLCLYDSTRPYQIDVPGPLHAIIVMMDQQSLPAFTAQFRHRPAIAIDGSDAAGRLSASFWRELHRENSQLEPRSLARLARAGFDIAGAALLGTAAAASPDALTTYALHRARTYMADHYHRPDLTIIEIARASGFSVRRLQELFQRNGTTIGRQLRELRLATACQRLSDPALAHRSIAFVAESVGLSDASTFGRLFRAAHSMSPRDYRRLSNENDMIDPTPPRSTVRRRG